MGLTINQYPTSSVNASNSDVLYVVTSISSSEPNYQYVCDIKDNDDNLVVRLKQRPNPSTIGVFNLNNILHKLVNPDVGDMLFDNTDWFRQADNNMQRFKILFGEEWSTTFFDFPQIYDGEGNEGAPVVSSSIDDWTYFTDVNVDRNVSLQSDWDVTPYYSGSANESEVFRGLSRIPRTNINIRENDYHLLSFMNGPIDENSTTYNDIYEVEYEYFDDVNATGTSLGTDSKTNTTATQGFAIAPRLTPGNLYSNSVFFQSLKYLNRVTHLKVGTQGLTLPVGTLSYKVNIKSQVGDFYDTLIFNISQNENCPYPFYRLMWVNEFGDWDFYNFEGRNQYTNQRNDTTYQRGFVNYSITSETGTTYDRSVRGKTTLYSEQSQRITVSTPFLTSEWANYLEGLLVSPNVYLVEDDGIIPINLITANYRKFVDPRSEKQKSYTIEFEYANNKRPY